MVGQLGSSPGLVQCATSFEHCRDNGFKYNQTVIYITYNYKSFINYQSAINQYNRPNIAGNLIVIFFAEKKKKKKRPKDWRNSVSHYTSPVPDLIGSHLNINSVI